MKCKKLIGFALAAALVVTSFTGCAKSGEKDAGGAKPTNTASEGSTTSGEDEKVTITIGGWPTPENEQYEYFENLKKTYTEKYPNVEFNTDEYLYSVDTFLPKAASGQLPNLFLTWFTETKKIMDAGYAEDITNLLTKNDVLNSINPELLPQVEKDGKYYGLPVSAYSMSMMFNVPLFKEAGLVDADGVPLFPKTWDEVTKTAVTIKEKTGKTAFFYPTTSNHGGWMFTNLAWSFGADFETQVDGKWKATFDSAEAVAALQYLKDLKWKYNVIQENSLVDLNDFTSQFGTDQVAMGLCHINMVNGIIKSTGMSKDNIAVSTVPEGPGGKAAQMGGNVYMLAPGTTEAQQEAIMNWLTIRGESPVFTDDAMAGFETRYKTNAEQNYPVGPMGVRIWTSGDRITKENDILNKYLNVDMKLWNTYSEHASENIKAEPPVNAQELYKLLDSAIQEVFTNKDADPQALLTKAAADFQKDYLDKVE